MFEGTFRGSPHILQACHHLIAHVNRRARKIVGPKYAITHIAPHNEIH
jgi:hypothetical protein